MLVTLTDVVFGLLLPSCFLSHTFFFFSTATQWWRTFVNLFLGQWLWCELIIEKVRPIHKCILGYRKAWPVSEKDLRILKGFALGREKGRPHRRFTGADCLSQPVSQSHVSLRWLCTLPRPHWRYSTGKEAKKQGFYMMSGLNNDVGAMNRGAHYSPWSFGSWPAASLVKAPVSNDPCQRLLRTAVMTYHTSSLRPHTDNYNHIYSFCCRIRPLLWQIDMVMRDAAVGEGAGEWNREGGQEQGNVSKHRLQQWGMTKDT